MEIHLIIVRDLNLSWLLIYIDVKLAIKSVRPIPFD